MSIKFDILNDWLDADTWYTAHPCDDERFYKAVFALLEAHKEEHINSVDVRDFIEARYRGQLEDEFLCEVSQLAALRFETIHEFCIVNNLL